MNSAHASSSTVQSGTMVKGAFRVLQVQGQNIQATVLNTSSATLKPGTSVTIHTNASTTYQRDGITARSVTITRGNEIMAGGTLNSDRSITALEVAIGDLSRGSKGGHDTCGNLQTATFSGTVTAIHGSVLTVADGMNGYRYNPSCNSFESGATLTFTVTTSANTQFVQGKSSTTALNDIKVGMEVGVTGTRANDGTIKADRIEVVQPYVIGKIVSISGSTMTLEGGLTVHTDANTKVLNKAKPQSFGLADLKVGDTIYATGTRNSDGSLTSSMVFYLGPYPQTSKNSSIGGK